LHKEELNMKGKITTRWSRIAAIKMMRSRAILLLGAAMAITSAAQTYTCTNTTPPVITSVDSASAYGGYPYFASGSWLEIKGTNLADPADPRLTAATNPGQWTLSDFNGVNAPTSLDGISVSINGKPAYVWYLSPTQLNVQAPEDSALGKIAITATNCKAISSPFMFTRQALAPGFLSPANYAAGGTPYMVATFAADGAYVLNTSTGANFGLTSRPAKPGDVIIAYGIGFGDVTPSILPGVIAQQSNALVNPVTVSFGPTPASLSYSGLAGNFVGLYEFYITVPLGLASGDYLISATQNGTKVPQAMYLTVQNDNTPPQVQSLTLSNTSVAGGGSVEGTVVLSNPAPPGGVVVALSSSAAVASVPATVTVPAASTSATFTVTTTTVSSSQSVTITGAYGGASAQSTLTVTPPGAPPFSFLEVVSATFQPTGYPSENEQINVSPNNGTSTFTIVLVNTAGPTFTNCTASNQYLTFTCNSLAPGIQAFSVVGALLSVSSASLTFTLTPDASLTPYNATVSGSLSVTGLISGTTKTTISGPLTGNVVIAEAH
jgi:uncharacterized protein (TIGR03437 family)